MIILPVLIVSAQNYESNAVLFYSLKTSERLLFWECVVIETGHKKNRGENLEEVGYKEGIPVPKGIIFNLFEKFIFA